MNTYINPKYSMLRQFIHSITDIFAHEGELMYDKRKIIKFFKIDNLTVNVK